MKKNSLNEKYPMKLSSLILVKPILVNWSIRKITYLNGNKKLFYFYSLRTFNRNIELWKTYFLHYFYQFLIAIHRLTENLIDRLKYESNKYKRRGSNNKIWIKIKIWTKMEIWIKISLNKCISDIIYIVNNILTPFFWHTSVN